MTSRPYCIAPFVHSAVSSNGQRQLCCAAKFSPFDVRDEPFDLYWNGEHMKSVRLKMIEQRPPPECKACIENEYSATSQRMQFQEKFKHDWDRISQNLTEEGVLSLPPQSLDYRSNNICNLACRTCNSGQSSTIRALEEKVFGKRNESKEINEFVSKEFEDLIEQYEITDLYFANGEPFLSPIFFDTFKKIKNGKNFDKTHLNVTTNLTVYNKSVEAILNWGKQLASFNLIISIDGYNQDAEMIREGLKWKTWVENLDQVLKIISPNNIRVNITVTLIGLEHISKLVKFLKERNLSFQFSHLIEPDPMTRILKCRGLPQRIILPITREIKTTLKSEDREVAELIQDIENEAVPFDFTDDEKLEYLLSYLRQVRFDQIKNIFNFKTYYHKHFYGLISAFVRLNFKNINCRVSENQIRLLFDYSFIENFNGLDLTLIVSGFQFRETTKSHLIFEELRKTNSKEILLFVLESHYGLFSRLINIKRPQNLLFESKYIDQIITLMTERSFTFKLQKCPMPTKLSYVTKMIFPKFLHRLIENYLFRYFPKTFCLHTITAMEFRRD